MLFIFILHANYIDLLSHIYIQGLRIFKVILWSIGDMQIEIKI